MPPRRAFGPHGPREEDEESEGPVLLHPVHLGRMFLRAGLEPELVLDLNRELQSCVAHAGKTPTAVQAILRKLAGCTPRVG